MQRSHRTPGIAVAARATSAARADRPRADAYIRVAALVAAVFTLLVLLAARATAMTQIAPTRAMRHADSSSLTPAPIELAAAPSPRLTPEEVVGIVLDALARNDSPVKDHGIWITFAFSSPANRAFVGPLESFADLVRDDTYRPLLNHRHASHGAAHITGDRATVRVVVTSTGGERVAYLFALSMQNDGTYKNCWMTDGVTREPPSALAGMRAAD